MENITLTEKNQYPKQYSSQIIRQIDKTKEKV